MPPLPWMPGVGVPFASPLSASHCFLMLFTLTSKKPRPVVESFKFWKLYMVTKYNASLTSTRLSLRQVSGQSVSVFLYIRKGLDK